MEAFSRTDHAEILSCLTDDVVWEMPGFFHLTGKAAFDGEIENDAFTGSPIITTTRYVEENNVVVCEGSVQSKKKDGSPFHAVFCDMFEMEGGKIKKLTSYVMVKPEAT